MREGFLNVSALRAVVKAAIALNQGVGDGGSDASMQFTVSVPGFAAAPWRERAVLFLREVLRYSRRDTALLLRISDGDVDQLLHYARQRSGGTDDGDECAQGSGSPAAAVGS